MSREEKTWLVWLLIMAVSFGILEGNAIRKQKHHATLTYTLRKQLGLDPVKPHRIIGGSVVVAASAWFAIHIVTGGLVPKSMRIVKEVELDVGTELQRSHQQSSRHNPGNLGGG